MQSQPTRTESSAKKVALGSFIGTAIEWYDFFLYGIAAAAVFNVLFFPNFDPVAGTLASFSTFAVGYFARPLGGIIFGHLGDRVGRKIALVTTLIMMGLGTTLIGLLPTYDSVGIWAPVLLVLLRLIQGLAVGGEWGGAVLMAAEHAPSGKRGIFASSAHAGAPAGLVLATGAFSLFALLPEDQFQTWGWRIPFLVSAALLIVGLVIRSRLDESPVFTQMKKSGTVEKQPVMAALRQPGNIIRVALLRAIDGSGSSIYSFFAATYAIQYLDFSTAVSTSGNVIGGLVGLIVLPIGAHLSDRFGRRRSYMAFVTFATIAVFPAVALIDSGVPALFFLAMALGLGVANYGQYGTVSAYFAELFPAGSRYTGASLGYQLGGAFFNGLAPLAATALFAATGSLYAVAGLIAVGGLLSLATAALSPETAHKSIDDATTPPGDDGPATGDRAGHDAEKSGGQ